MNTSTKALTARIAHRCEDCQRRAIGPGHRYQVTTFFPGHDINSGTKPFTLKRCMHCAAEYDSAIDLTIRACGTFCCGEVACARPVHHTDDHSCREEALQEAIREINRNLREMAHEVLDQMIATQLQPESVGSRP